MPKSSESSRKGEGSSPHRWAPAKSPGKRQVGATTAVVSAVVTVLVWYTGSNMLLPVLGGALMVFFASKVMVIRDPAYIMPLAVLFGHFTWILTGAIYLANSDVVLDLVLMGFLIVWLWARPGLWSGGAIVAFSLLPLADGVITLSDHVYGDSNHKALVTHVCLRVFVIAALVEIYWRKRKASASATTTCDPGCPPSS